MARCLVAAPAEYGPFRVTAFSVSMRPIRTDRTLCYDWNTSVDVGKSFLLFLFRSDVELRQKRARNSLEASRPQKIILLKTSYASHNFTQLSIGISAHSIDNGGSQ